MVTYLGFFNFDVDGEKMRYDFMASEFVSPYKVKFTEEEYDEAWNIPEFQADMKLAWPNYVKWSHLPESHQKKCDMEFVDEYIADVFC